MVSKEFPNGLTSYLETYYEVVSKIEYDLNVVAKNLTWKINESQGKKGLYDLAQDLTLKFEQQYAPTWFEIYDFYETIDKFLEEELYEKS